MKTLLSTLAGAALLVLTTATQAGLVHFDAPGLVDIDPVSGQASYTEAGFVFSGDAAAFLPLDGVGRDGSGALVILADQTVGFAAVGGGLFTLLSFDFGLLDLFSSVPAPTLLVQGLLADNSQLSQTLSLGGLTDFQFSGWNELLSVRFSANADVVLDNVSAVPEPASLALAALGLLGVAGTRRRRPAAH